MHAEEHFDYLFRDHGFMVDHTESLRWGALCYLILESPLCQVKISSEIGRIGVHWGPLSAPKRWDDTGWYFLGSIMAFLLDEMPSLEETFARSDMLRKKSVEEGMAYWSAKMKPFCGKILEIFADPAGEEMMALDEFRQRYRKELGRQFELRSPSH